MTKKVVFNCFVIGAGVIGTMISRELMRYQLMVALIDKENDVGNVTSNANSAIIHSGYDPEPGSLKAKFNVLGNQMFDQVAKDLDVHFGRIGSLTIAIEDEQLETLKDLVKRSKENGVKVELLDAEETRKIEPNIANNVKGALFAPTCGIIDPFNLCVHAAENAVDNGVNLILNEEVISIDYLAKEKIYEIKTNKNTYFSEIVINAAGLCSDKIARMIEDVDWRITPRKGEYYVLDHFTPSLVNHVIFPLPSKKGKGVLVTLTTSGNHLIGPSSELVDDVEDFSTDKLTLNDVFSQAQLMVKNIPINQTVRTFSGLRATSTRHDIIIESAKTHKTFINVAGIESPGLVSSPAIAKYVVEELVKPLIPHIQKNPYFNPKIRKHISLKELSIADRNKMISKNSEYGEIICSCEKVSLGEIKDELNRSVPPTTIKGVKRRVRAGFGMCQGGFCSPKVTFILAKHYGISPLQVKWDKDNSEILKEKIKTGK